MRTAWTALAVALAAVTACTPDVAPGTYLCGPDGLCPEGQQCNGTDNLCVLPSQAQPFSCNGVPDLGGDELPATGAPLASLGCASTPTEVRGCLTATDGADFFQFDVPVDCTVTRVEVIMTFPIGFQPLGFQFAAGTGAPAPVESPCPSSTVAAPGEEVRCLLQPIRAGEHYAFGILKDGDTSCDGACPHNRYSLRARLRSQ